MSLDINHILDSWPFKPGEVNVRRIVGDDGREKIQLRLDLGMLQMEATGRPDGQRPHDCDNLLGHYERRLAEHKAEHGDAEGFKLDATECEQLRAEGVMYYHRYLAEFILGDYKAVVRDTKRNLAMFDFCAAHAAEHEDRHMLEQYRPYVLMMYARAHSRAALKRNRTTQALAVVQRTIRRIEECYEKYGQADRIESSAELALLNAIVHEIQTLMPIDPMARLRKQLQKAIDEERYEDAATIRDNLDKRDAKHHANEG
jgi:protein-arginine kinase activator protein McsA